MKKKRFLLILVLTLLFFVALIWFQSDRLLRSPQVQELLVQKIQVIADGTLHYQSLEVGFFPQPIVTLVRPQFVFSNNPLVLEAEKLRFDFDILPMAFGRAEPSAIYISGGKADTQLPGFQFLGELALRNFTLKMGAIRSNLAIPIQFESDVGDKKRTIFMKGHFVTASVEKIDWLKTSARFLAELKELPLTGSQSRAAGPDPFFFFKKGTLSASLEVKKKENDPSLVLSANGTMGGFTYEVRQEKEWIAPPAVDAVWGFSGEWDTSAEELRIQKSALELPFGKLDVSGGLKFRTGEISKLHFSASNMVLENLLKYWPRLEDALPFHIGFSGPSAWMLSLEGTLDHLSLHLNLDFTQTLLTYGTYFTKAKDVPLMVTFDYLIQKGATLSGDFSVRFQEMSLKGNLTDLDLASGTGQLNLLTNKFPMKGWEQYIPALQGYKVEGNAKVLANWKGDLRKLEKAEQIFHVTIEKGDWTNSKGQGIKNANLSFDYSPLMFEGRGMQFDLSGFPVMADLRVTNLTDNPEMQGKIASGELDPRQCWDGVRALFQRKKEQAAKDTYDYVEDSIFALFPQGQRLKDFSAEAHYLGGVWELQKLHALAYEGTLDAKGSIDLAAQPVKYNCEGEIKGMNFDSFLNRAGGSQGLFEGSLFLKANLEGTGWGAAAWRESLTGQGKFTLSNGKSPLFDAVKPLATLEPFSGIEEIVKSLEAFDQLDFSWNLAGGKISAGDFLIKSSDHIIDGEGTVDFDGLVNFKWEVFLPTSLAAEIFPDMASTFRDKPKAHLGPVPVLVSGMVSDPNLKPDSAQVEDLLRKIDQRKAKDLLYELVLN